MEEIDDPEQGIDRMLEYYHRKGYSENWINQRLKSIEVRKELTDEWERRGIKKGQEYATLTDIITLGWSGMTTRQYKQYKGLKTESLRDNMTNLELVLNMLAEATTTEISKERKPRTTAANRAVAAQGGRIAREYPPRDRSPDRKKNRIAAHGKTGIGRKNSRRDRTPGGGYDRMIRRFAIGLRPQFVTSNSKSQNGISN